jgi:hypothetical protein
MQPSTIIGLAAGLAVLAALAVVLWRRSQNNAMKNLDQIIAIDRLENFFVSDGLGGEVHIDRLLLTRHGLLLLETKDTEGMVFAGDRMDTWSATRGGQRFTFENPIPMLAEKADALELLAPGIPIDFRVLFVAEATFPKGHPDVVCTPDELIEQYRAMDSDRTSQDFSGPWQAIRDAAGFV